MITFFRKIRKSLIGSSSFKKYTLYAIGEILLVMVGILLALQVNEWNERRKERKLEKETLLEIAENISLNIEEFEEFISGGWYADQASDYVLSVLEGDIPYSDSLDLVINIALFQRNKVQYTTAAYESLKNNNLNLIQNRSLKKAIVSLFEISYPNFSKNLEWESSEALQEYMDHHFFPSPLENGMRWSPYDFNVQLGDNYFKTLIAKVKMQRNYYAWMANSPLEDSKAVLQLLNTELNI